MGKISNQQIISIGSLLLSALITVITKDLPPVLRWITVGLILLLALTYFIYSMLSAIRVRNSISSTAIIAKSKKYIDYLYKLSKANEKKLKKFAAVNDLKVIERINKKVVKTVRGKNINLDNNKRKALQKDLNVKIDDYQKTKKANYDILKYDDQIIKNTKHLSGKKTYEITQKIITSICDLNRILLQIDQHKLRIKLGKFVAKYTDNLYTQLDAYIDYIGWTYILIGNVNKGFKAIMTGIGLIEQQIGDGSQIPEDMRPEDFCHLMFMKARAYRHLGTTYYTYASRHIDPTAYLNKALEIVNNPIFLEKFKNRDCDCENRYQKLRIGIENNLLLAEYYKLTECMKNKCMNDSNCTFDSLAKDIDEKIAEVKQMKKMDKHRLIKLLVLKNQIIMTNKYYTGIEIEGLEDNLKAIKGVFEQNINFDDAMEVFIQQKIQSLYDDVLEIIRS